MRAAIYVRAGRVGASPQSAVEMQAAACAEFVANHGWQVVETYVDCGSSAEPRTNYDAMLDAARAGQVDAIVTWRLDRLARSSQGLKDIIDVCEHGVALHCVESAGPDLNTASGRLEARILAAVSDCEAVAAPLGKARER